jgi:hypothetical protein
MKAYPDDLTAVNLYELLPETRAPWSLAERLAWTRQNNPRHTSGAGARRRSCYEHQVDEHLALLRACDQQGATYTRGRRSTLRPWELLHAPLAGRARAIEAYRAQLLPLIAWTRANHPRRVGWALPQSRPRAAALPTATEYYLPRASWRAFLAWRRVIRRLERLLQVLHTWWGSLIPAPRSASPRPLAEETRSEHGASGQPGTRYRDQSARGGAPVPLGALLPRLT